jgi:hypothetical protein
MELGSIFYLNTKTTLKVVIKTKQKLTVKTEEK